jgi:hypothetical protein
VRVWTKDIPKEIKLTYLSSKHIKEFLSHWKKSEFDVQALKFNKPLNLAFDFLIPHLEHNKNQVPIRSIFTSVNDHFSAFAIIEEPYLDLEFWDSYSGFYSYSFSQYSIAGKRLHFFTGKEENHKELAIYLAQGASSQKIEIGLGINWIGYCNLRPIHTFIVGRTAIKFDDRPINLMNQTTTKFNEEMGGKPYLKSSSSCSANLLSTHFKINTPEFIQQDPNIGQCATASLWVANKIMAESFGTNRLFYRSITKQAVGQWNREFEVKLNDEALTFSEDGTTVAEIKNAISATGVRVMSFAQSSKESIDASNIRLTNIIYSFVESGFPVLLCINSAGKRHVITIVGHCLPKVDNLDFINISSLMSTSNTTSLESAIDEKHYLIGNRVNVYYCHDDAYGPFNRACLKKNSSKIKQQIWHQLGIKETKNDNNSVNKSNILLILGRDKVEYGIENVIIPVPPYVKTSPVEPFRDLVTWFNSELAPRYLNKIFFWRSILVLGSDFKTSLAIRDYHSNIVEWYSKLHLPKYVWLFELSIIDRNKIDECFYFDGFRGRYISGEFLFDATITENITRMISGRLLKNYIDYSALTDRSNEMNSFSEINEIPEYGCYIQNMVDDIKNQS